MHLEDIKEADMTTNAAFIMCLVALHKDTLPDSLSLYATLSFWATDSHALWLYFKQMFNH